MLSLSSWAADRTFANKRAIQKGREEEAITSVVSSGFLYEIAIETTTSYLLEAIPAYAKLFEREKNTRF
jgi:hypothetical protein